VVDTEEQAQLLGRTVAESFFGALETEFVHQRP